MAELTFPGELKVTNPLTSNRYVYAVQTRLQELNYSVGGRGADSIYGSDTEKAVIAYQKANDISTTGIVDKATWNSLWSMYAKTTMPEDTSDSYYSIISGSNERTESVDIRSLSTSACRNIDTVGSFIAHIGSQRWMPLPVNPTQITKQSTSRWEPTQIPGRSSSFYHYAGTANSTYSFSLKLHTDMNQIVIPKSVAGVGQLIPSTNYEETGISIESFVNFVESLTLPRYTASIIRPPLCKIVIENVLNIRCFLNSYSIVYDGPMRKYVGGSSKGKIGYTMYEISFLITEIPNTVVDAINILNTEQDASTQDHLRKYVRGSSRDKIGYTHSID